MPYLKRSEIEDLGFAKVGENVLISRKASLYNCKEISIGSNVRIDDFCVLSAGAGGILIGSYVHVAVYSLIIGASKITLSDFCNLSSRTSIYSSSDDYSGATMTNPMIPAQFKNVDHADVYLGRHVIVGCGSIILPGSILGDGVAVGALSLINSNCKEFGIYAGIPARFVKSRMQNLIALESRFKASL